MTTKKLLVDVMRERRDAANGQASENGRASAAPEPEPAAPAEDGLAIIIAHFRDRYRPAFRRGWKLFSASLGREVAQGEATGGASPGLLLSLAGAADAPRDKEGAILRQQLPWFFSNWARSAWAAVLDALPDEEAALAADPAAREEMRQLVRGAMLGMVTLGVPVREGGKKKLRQEQRALIDWCDKFAKAGGWESVRSLRCWCRLTADGEVEVAVRPDLFNQLKADRTIAGMTCARFARLAVTYGIAESMEAESCGKHTVQLTTEFLAELRAGPA